MNSHADLFGVTLRVSIRTAAQLKPAVRDNGVVQMVYSHRGFKPSKDQLPLRPAMNGVEMSAFWFLMISFGIMGPALVAVGAIKLEKRSAEWKDNVKDRLRLKLKKHTTMPKPMLGGSVALIVLGFGLIAAALVIMLVITNTSAGQTIRQQPSLG